MRKISIIALGILAIMLVSCSGKDKKIKEIKEMVGTLQEAVSNNDHDAIVKIYPGAEACDSFNTFTADLENFKIDEGTSKGTYEVPLNDSITIYVDASGDTAKIVNSRHLFAFPAKLTEFAKATGWIKGNESDKDLAEAFKDKSFMEWLPNKVATDAKNDIKKNVKIVSTSKEYVIYAGGLMMSSQRERYDCTVRVKNNSDYTVMGSWYSISAHASYYPQEYDASEYHSQPAPYNDSFAGKKINPHSSATITFKLASWEGWLWGCKLSSNLVWKNIDDAAILANYKYTGKEYEEYINSQKK